MKAAKMFYAKARWMQVTRLMARDGNLCKICGKPLDRKVRDVSNPSYISFDHIVPRSRGGLDCFNNLRLAHRLCNSLRGNDPLEEGPDV